MLNNFSLRQKLLLAWLPLIIALGYFTVRSLLLSFQQANTSQVYNEFQFQFTIFAIAAGLLLTWTGWLLHNVIRTFNAFAETIDKLADGQWHELEKFGGKRELQLTQSLNRIQMTLRDNQQLMSELKRVFNALSSGDLTQKVNDNYTGTCLILKEDINSTIVKLYQSVFDIKQAIDAAAQGVFDKRVSLENKQGVFRELAENLNHNLVLNQQVIEEVMRVFAAVSEGDLMQTMTQNYGGSLGQLKIDVNASVRKLNEVMDEISTVAESAARGVFDKRINLVGKEGFFKTISDNLNRNLDVNQRIIEELMVIFAAMSQGNLQKYLVNEYVGKLAELKHDVNATVKKLNDMMSNISQLTEQVDNGAQEIAQGNMELSQRTEQQAAALEETASSMQEMTDTVRQTADNAQTANQLSLEAKLSAEQGGKVVYSAIQAMLEINRSSNQMSDIISVIDEIAFQTNLLALNAAVEAARAGEQGRGFAVVAIEVRNLAQRSASAAKEIKQLIKSSISKVDEGSQLVNQSGKALDEIVLNVKKVSDIIAEIAAAGQEQSSGILQVNRAVTQFDETTQQNAAMVEEITANSNSTREQVKLLRKLLSFFQFEGSNQVATADNIHPVQRHAPALSPPHSHAHVSPSHPTTPAAHLVSHTKPAVTPRKKVATAHHTNTADEEWEEF